MLMCFWDHSGKPSVFVVKQDGNEIYRGTYVEGYKLYEERREQMRTPTPDTDECIEKWEAFTVGEQLLFTRKLARLLEQQRDEARYVAYGLSGGGVGKKIESNYSLTKVWGDQYRRMILTKAKDKKR